MKTHYIEFVAILIACAAGPTAWSVQMTTPPMTKEAAIVSSVVRKDDHHFSEQWTEGLQDMVRRGDFPDRSQRAVAPAAPIARGAGDPGCVTTSQIFAFEDTNKILLTNFTTGQLLNLMFDAGEALIAENGDNFDFIGYWINFVPDHQIGSAFYAGIFNDVQGIGLALFDNRPFTITNTNKVEGIVMMWNINTETWVPGDGPEADWVRLVLGQEFEHRFGMFLPPLADGRSLQGDNVCGRSAHWSFHVDGQGSSMEILEWIGENPAEVLLVDTFPLTFNTDISDGVWSYTDLYLMGYVSPQEMDAGNSELRYMDDWACDAPFHAGDISHFDSSDIIETAGERIPDSLGEDKDFRTGWVVIHLPGDEPDQAELEKAAAILNQHTIDWDHSTLGRGTMDNTIFDDCNCNGVPDADDIANKDSADINNNGVPDECECVADLDGSGEVGVSDLLAFLAAWGTDPAGPPDLNDDGIVGVADLLLLLAAWGPCE